MMSKIILIYTLILAGYGLANITGIDSQNFNPAHGVQDFVTVNSSSTVKHYDLNLSTFVDVAVNSFPYGASNLQGIGNYNDSLVYLNNNLSYGLLENLDIALSMPFILHTNNVDKESPRGEFAAVGLTEIKFASKYKLQFTDVVNMALLGSLNLNLVEDNPFIGKSAVPIFNLEFIIDKKVSIWHISYNIGYRLRPKADPIENSISEPLDSQVVSSLGVTSQLDTNISAVLELYGAYSKESNKVITRSVNIAEMLLGGKYKNSGYSIDFGFTTGINVGLSTPAYRLYLGFNKSLGWSKIKNHFIKQPRKKSNSNEHKKEIENDLEQDELEQDDLEDTQYEVEF